MKKIILIFSSFIFFSACVGINTWNKQYKDAFIEGCIEEAGEFAELYEGFCECMLNEIMADFTPTESMLLIFSGDDQWELIGENCGDEIFPISNENEANEATGVL